MPHVSRSSVHWSARWPHLFVSWHRGINVRSINWGVCKGCCISLWWGTREISWGPAERSTGMY